MRFSSKDNKEKLQSRLKTLVLCSQYKTIKYSNKINKKIKEREDELNKLENTDLHTFLAEVYLNELKESEYTDFLSDPPTYKLASFVVPEERYNIPDEIREALEKHQQEAKVIQSIEATKAEHEELRQLIYGHESLGRISNNVDLDALNNYLKDESHSKAFNNFSKSMLNGNQLIITTKYKNAALKLARDEKIANQTYADKIVQTYNLDTIAIGLADQQMHKVKQLYGKIAAASLAVFLTVAGSSAFLNGCTRGDDQPAPKPTPTEAPVKPTPTPQIDGLLPNDTSIKTYDEAANDFFKKLKSIYSYNTNGKTIDLSGLTYKDIRQNYTNLLLVKYDGKIQTFSTSSNVGSNAKYLEQALTAAGGEIIEKRENQKITFIMKNGESIGIADSEGNSVKSGIVVESNGNYDIFNPSLVSEGKQICEKKGISIEGKSEGELAGIALLETESIVKRDVSEAIGELIPLADIIHSNFGYGEEAAVKAYKDCAANITKSYNDSILEIYQTKNGDKIIIPNIYNEKTDDDAER